MPIVQDHGVVVETLTADALGFFGDARPDMHVGRIPPDEEGLVLRVSLV